jgi:hypothetical protein
MALTKAAVKGGKEKDKEVPVKIPDGLMAPELLQNGKFVRNGIAPFIINGGRVMVWAKVLAGETVQDGVKRVIDKQVSSDAVRHANAVAAAGLRDKQRKEREAQLAKRVAAIKRVKGGVAK